MKYVEVVAEAGSGDTVAAIAEKVKAKDFRLGAPGDDGMQQMRILVGDDPVSYTHLTLPTTIELCRSRWSPYH